MRKLIFLLLVLFMLINHPNETYANPDISVGTESITPVNEEM